MYENDLKLYENLLIFTSIKLFSPDKHPAADVIIFDCTQVQLWSKFNLYSSHIHPPRCILNLHWYIHPPRLFIVFYLSINLAICSSVYIFINLYLFLPFIYVASIFLLLCLPIYPSIYLFIYLSIYLYIYLPPECCVAAPACQEE